MTVQVCTETGERLTSIHDVNVGLSSTHFGVQDDETNRPIRHAAEYDEEDQTHDETGFS